MAQPTKAKAIERLRKVLNRIPELKKLPSDNSEFRKWRRDTEVAITNTFGREADHVKDFKKINFSLPIITSSTSKSDFQEFYVRGLESAVSVLESMLDEIEEYWEEDETSPKISDSSVRMQSKNSNKVFVIHGHDEATRETIARFLEKLCLEPIILHEQPNRGRTIIEKFEDYADVKFAIVLLTPDDVGALKVQQGGFKPRARQNVVFEFGYFIGKLGRDRVCALASSDIEKPSDLDGILYIPLDDNNGWMMQLLRELKAANFDVDANQVFLHNRAHR